MAHFLTVALSFPGVVYTVLLGVMLVYWVFVMIGAAHVNLLGEGAGDAAADAAIDGMAKGALEGATKGMFEGAADHLEGPDAAGHDAGDAGDLADGSGAGGLMAALKLRSAPATVVMSVLILFAWFLTMAAMQAWDAFAQGAMPGPVRVAVVILAPILALLPTSLAVRPLAPVFRPPTATKHEALVGKLCTIRTGTVTDRFGEALLEDGGPGVVVRVRVAAGEKLGRGDQAVIIGYDAERGEFAVAPMEGLLDDEPRADEAADRKRARRGAS